MKYTTKNLGKGNHFLMVNEGQLEELVEDGIISDYRLTARGLTCVSIEDDGWMDDDGRWYRNQGYVEIKIEDLLINNKKQTKMTTKAIAIAKARMWPTKDLTTGQKFLTKQGEIVIHKTKGGDVYVVSNISQLDGSKPRPMPAGYKYGFSLSAYGGTVNLTCGGKLTAFKEQMEEIAKEMKFTANMVVGGSPSLLKAIKEEAEEIGWKFVGAEITKATSALRFVKGEFCVTTQGENYYLADEWKEVLDNLREKEEVDDVEYIKCIVDNQYGCGISPGRIYKRDKDAEEYEDGSVYCIEEGDFEYSDQYYDKHYFVAATQEEYDEQGPNIFAVGGHKINIKDVKINGYEIMKMACIGCANSQQVYSVGALKALYDAMCDEEATFDEEEVRFTKDQVEALIEALS